MFGKRVEGFSDERMVRLARATGIVCSWLAVVVATAVLAGWALGKPIMTSAVPGLTAMNPTTAVGFILTAAAVLSWGPGRTGARRWLPVALAVAVGVLGSVRFAGYVFDWNLPIDRWLFSSRLDVGGTPNRMAPNTAFNFWMTSGALGALMVGRQRLAQVLALIPALTAFVALMGYAYSVTALAQVTVFIPMALPTAVLFLVVPAAVLCAMPGTGLVAELTRQSPGGRVMRRMLPMLLFGPPVLGWLRLQGELVGLYRPASGVSYTVAAMVILGLTLVWKTARVLDRGEVERRSHHETVLRLAHFDHLTGLPNRMLFEDRLRRALVRSQRAGDVVALLFLDLDGFKRVNDTLGHAAGDQVLAEAARRIESTLRAVDTAARLGGDEFAIVLEQVGGTDGALVVARRLLLELSRPYSLAGPHHAQLSVSIGVALSPRNTQTSTEVISLADAAMYRAKRAGKNQVVVHDLLRVQPPQVHALPGAREAA